ncbi:hypothetical protein E2C01_093827 [Portunus trituberculatus]|uniref:Uncharacterized protein n=1 Tax=Portunus trituberculatus TaxID=210409 RepID=A0A5B7JVW8_PORTR|nr:hypothetical protein [Portunus trituberculatus]
MREERGKQSKPEHTETQEEESTAGKETREGNNDASHRQTDRQTDTYGHL